MRSRIPTRSDRSARPHPGVDLRVDADGHLLVRPPNSAVGIEERIDADGFIDTGDLARVDDDGFVWIEGRAGDVINRGGNKVFPDAVEEVLRLSPAVDDVAVAGVADERLGEVPVAFLVGRPCADAELVALCRDHLVAYKVPVTFQWVDELPRSEVGKVPARSARGRIELVISLDEAARLALALPEVTEGERHGHRTWFVNGKGFAWERPFSKADIRRFGDEPAPDGPILAVSVADLGEKEAVLGSGLKGFFTIPHFDGYAAVLIQLRLAGKKAVREILIDGWLACAPAKLADDYVNRSKRPE